MIKKTDKKTFTKEDVSEWLQKNMREGLRQENDMTNNSGDITNNVSDERLLELLEWVVEHRNKFENTFLDKLNNERIQIYRELILLRMGVE